MAFLAFLILIPASGRFLLWVHFITVTMRPLGGILPLYYFNFFFNSPLICQLLCLKKMQLPQ